MVAKAYGADDDEQLGTEGAAYPGAAGARAERKIAVGVFDGMNERDVAIPVMEWLKADGWDCYPEANVHYFNERADIAAVRNGKLWIVEAKTSLSLQLLDQAYKWTYKAHFVSVAIPWRRRDIPMIASQFLKTNKIGLITVYKHSVEAHIGPGVNRSAHAYAKRVISGLHPDMKRYVPGTPATEGYSTPFRRTINEAVRFIYKHPGCSIKDVMNGINHHYLSDATARSCVPKWLRELESDRIRAEVKGRKLLFYPKSDMS